MELIRGLHNLRPRHHGCVATIGNFDGVHLGHQAVLRNLRQKASELALPLLVMIFEPHPLEFFAPDKAPPRITRLSEKLERLAWAGADRVLLVRFDARFAGTSPQAFVNDLLLGQLGVAYLVVGDDFRFGSDRAGDWAMLQSVAAQRPDFAVSQTPSVCCDDGQRISSTRIRQYLLEGRMDAAAQQLGWRWGLTSRVVHGHKLGRHFGVPTANFRTERNRLPVTGVFAVQAERLSDGRVWQGVANLGIKPSISGKRQPLLEAHFFDCDEWLYGQKFRVCLHHKLRDEQHFSSFDALKAAIAADVEQARQWWAHAMEQHS